MAYVKVGMIESLPPGAVTQAEIGEAQYALCNVNGEVFALEGVCPHAGGPLGEGTLQGCMVVCPWHGFEFDCRTGENDMDPGMTVARFAVKVEDGEILIDPSSKL